LIFLAEATLDRLCLLSLLTVFIIPHFQWLVKRVSQLFLKRLFLSCLPNALDFFSQTIGRGRYLSLLTLIIILFSY
jgi:hypothetical protein